ncbi:MAG: rhodanese-like domain-containing protein [Gammaproteobacteria bacterium SHHR-1]|uniref:rhodanese-like domain-containing protein n=1 Tax=Magnetovirga frankeli TaxID=947516 RepID=UPI0012933693|nr:rhodanese-like domain-containing protein [gamma proteobacterium SS-5]
MATQQLLDFAANHYLLVGGFILVLSLLIQDIISGGSGKDTVDPSGATELINNEEALVIDVRPAADFNKAHIINARNIPMSGFAGQIDSLRKYQERPLILSCNSGAQSASACRILRKAGFSRVFNLRGGILAWQNANFPVSRKRK